MNVKMVVNMAEDERRHVKIVKARDDIASPPPQEAEKRHGIAGGGFHVKTAGALAQQGGTLKQVIALATKTAQRTRSVCVAPLGDAKDIARQMVDALWEVFGPQAEHGVFAMMVSGLGATPLMEQYLMAGHVVDELTRHGARVWRSYVGNYVTSLDMNGLCLTLLLLDDELQRTLNFPAAPLGLASL